jgi:hypothetical protein
MAKTTGTGRAKPWLDPRPKRLTPTAEFLAVDIDVRSRK